MVTAPRFPGICLISLLDGRQRCPQAKRVPSVPGKRWGRRRTPVLSAPCRRRGAGAGGHGRGGSFAEVAAPKEEGSCWAVSPPGPLPLDVTLGPPRLWTPPDRVSARDVQPAGASRMELEFPELGFGGSGVMLLSHGTLIPPYPPVLLLLFIHRSSVLPFPWAVGEKASPRASQPPPQASPAPRNPIY